MNLLRLLAVCILVVGVSTPMGMREARAQANTPESLIENLQKILGEAGGLGGLGDNGSVLDRIRSDAEESAKEDEEDAIPNKFRLDPSVELLVRRFCRDELDEADSEFVQLIPLFSAIERDYCQRSGGYLRQIGYEIFEGTFGSEVLSTGAVDDGFVLGVGDQLVITFIGSDANTAEVKVDREGKVALKDLPPIAAAGRSLGEFKKELAARSSAAFLGTEVFASLGAVRKLSILVVGEVGRPGLHRVTALSSVLDVIGVAGGIRKTGSLRKIQVLRRDQVLWIDAYDLIFGTGAGTDFRVMEGDRIVVPSIGPTIAVVGDVRGPAVAELGEGQATADTATALRFAGGLLRPRGNRYFVASFDDQGREQVREVDAASLQLRDGDILSVVRGRNIAVGGVALEGHVRVPGRRALAASPTVAALLRGREALDEDAYLPLAILITQEFSSDRFLPLDLGRVLDFVEDFSLRGGDRLVVLSREDIEYLGGDEVQEIIGSVLDRHDRADEASGGRRDINLRDSTGPGVEAPTLERLSSASRGVASLRDELTDLAAPQSQSRQFSSETAASCRSLDGLAKIVSEVRASRFSNALVPENRRRAGAAEARSNRWECRQIYEDIPGLLPFVLEHVVGLTGEVRRPGVYPVANTTTLAALVGVGGGLTRDVDLSRTEMTTFGAGRANRQLLDLTDGALGAVQIGPGDVVRFSPVESSRETGSVQLLGEFSRPGVFDIRRGERLSEVIARAGGPTAQAYPFGAIFTRERVRLAEEVALRRLARDLRSAVAVAAANGGIDGASVQAFAELTGELTQTPATGRVVIEADPTVLQVRPELDVVLQPGDRVFLPKRPNSVLVTGDVLNPGAMQFQTSKTVDSYIRQAGGFQQSADRNRIFVVFPNGAAQPVSVSAFNFTQIQVPPGSTIVVPKDATPFNAFTITKEVATILSQLAIIAASLAVISDN